MVKAELIPAALADEVEFDAMVAALVRTGFLTTNSAWDYQMYDPSPLLMRIVSMIDSEVDEA
ncbi:hypothetical protein [Cupriavidus metallidurans]|uniref:Uncharacterized protein n=1 Tax=Cupriavidus metallidurans TaxID=119219 RepID=A0A482IX06_9BURK|nr:hypothetical protein [Cupriavidus metallidurans]QBP12506.1 hypothetical protein DDF84_022530 [Cupriavidus metallidurans]